MSGLYSSRRRSRPGTRPAVAVLLLAAVLCGAASAAVEILPLGDSITHGGIGADGVLHPSYRADLYQDLRTLGYDVDFVGSEHAPELPGGVDPDNEGHPGYTANQTLAGLPGWLEGYPPPDVALIHLGTNDADQDVPRTETIDALTSIVGVLRARNPSMAILVAQIIPTSFASSNTRIAGLNREIAGLRSLSTAQSPVIVVDQWSGYDGLADNQADGVHPLASGEEKMAARWEDALSVLPPHAITGLRNITYEPTAITWTWTDPADPDFANVTVCIDGVPVGAVDRGVQGFTATDLAPATAHMIATRTADTSGSVGTAWVNHTAITASAPVVLLPIPGGAGAPTDTNVDNLYDDVNGNGRKDFADVVLYFNRMAWIAANEPVSLFDYGGNGRIDFADVVLLFNHL